MNARTCLLSPGLFNNHIGHTDTQPIAKRKYSWMFYSSLICNAVCWTEIRYTILTMVLARINALSNQVREDGGTVIFIRHCGAEQDGFVRRTPSWEFLPSLNITNQNVVVEKTFNDAFAGTDLKEKLDISRPLTPADMWVGPPTFVSIPQSAQRSPTNFRSRSFQMRIRWPNRPHLPASQVKTHHHWLWQNLITKVPIHLAATNSILRET